MVGILMLMTLGSAAPSAAPSLSCAAVPGWEQEDEARVFEPDNLFDYMNGNAEGYLVYGFTRMDGITCVKDGVRLVIDLSDMSSPDYAYGILSAHRDPRVPLEKIGMGAQITPTRASLAKGRFYLEIAAQASGDHTPVLRAFATKLADRIGGRETSPDALSWFPEEGLTSGEPRLIPESVLGIRTLESGYSARYETGEAFVVPCDSPDDAAQVMAKLRERFEDTKSVALAEEAFSASDKYLGGLLVVRKGAFVTGVARVPAGATPEALVGSILRLLP